MAVNPHPLDTFPGEAHDPTVEPTQIAKKAVFDYVKAHLEKTDTHVTFAEDEVYVVWFAYTLGNWKALVSTTLPDGMYYEVTHSAVREQTYLDAYKKFENQVVDPLFEEERAS